MDTTSWGYEVSKEGRIPAWKKLVSSKHTMNTPCFVPLHPLFPSLKVCNDFFPFLFTFLAALSAHQAFNYVLMASVLLTMVLEYHFILCVSVLPCQWGRGPCLRFLLILHNAGTETAVCLVTTSRFCTRNVISIILVNLPNVFLRPAMCQAWGWGRILRCTISPIPCCQRSPGTHLQLNKMESIDS